MKVTAGPLDGVVIFEPVPSRDDRGLFTRTFDVDVARQAGVDPTSFLQDSQSRTLQGVVRGLHFRTDGKEAKLVRCARGQVLDVAVDLRPWSPTFRQVQTVILDDQNFRSVYLPAGLAHGLQALTDSDVCYRIDAAHEPSADATLLWNDPELGIDWPLPVTTVSERDRAGRPLAELAGLLPEWLGTGPGALATSGVGSE
jgi:dTDP-4-dehydrorhamnose 3,5-epimerase